MTELIPRPRAAHLRRQGPCAVYALGAALLVAAAAERAQACASCGCALSSDAAMGYSAVPGWRMSIEYDYINQDQLRSGSHSVSGVPDGTELEHETLNRYITAAVNYSPNSSWNITLFMPWVVRDHSTYGEFDSTQPLPPLSYSHSSSIGDVKLIASYQGWLATRNLGVQLGLKLPTGQYGTAVQFSSGPNAGEPLDASLQPGTGSTDIIVGAYYYRAISQNFDAFVNGQFQAAVTHRMDEPGNDFRPGNSLAGSFGLRYEAHPRWVPQLQVNLLYKSPDQGALADVQNTAGTVVYLSPGITVEAASALQLFGFVQLPVYSNLYGIQLFPRYTVSVGASYAL